MTGNSRLRQEPGNPRHTRALLLFIILLALALRLIRLGTYSFWADEAYNLVLSDDLVGIFFHGRFLSTHPPMAYVLLFLWRMAGMGLNEWTIRALPALFGVLGVGAVYWLGKMLFDTRAGLLAAFILAVSPFHVLHSQDLKEYIYLPFFATLMVGFFYRAVMENRRRDWLLYGLTAGLCCYTEVFVGPLLLTINCWFLCLASSYRDRIKGWFLSNMLGALLFLPWLGMTLHKILTYMIHAEGWWVPWPSPWGILFYFKTIAFGYAAIKPFFYIAFLVFAALFAYGMYRAWRQNKRTAMLVIMWAIMPVAFVYVISFVGQSIFLIRSMIPYSIAVYLLVALALASLKPKFVRYGALVTVSLLCALGLGAHYLRVMHPHEFPHRPGIHPPKDYDLAARFIRDNIQENDLVVHTGIATWLPFYWYAFSDYPQHTGAYNEAFNDFIRTSTPVNTDDPVFLQLWPQVMENLVPGYDRIWLIYAEWEQDYLRGNPANVHRWMDSRYYEVKHKSFLDIDVMLYLAPSHADAPTVIKRDNDAGVTAHIHYADREPPYLKRAPEGTTAPLPPGQSQGTLMVQFNPSEPEARHGAGKHELSFNVVNTGQEPAACEVHFLASHVMMPAAALERTNPDRNVWYVGPMYNFTPPPFHYNIPTLCGDLRDGSDTVFGKIMPPTGVCTPYVFTTAPWNNHAYGLAPIRIQFDNHDFLPADEIATRGWQWVRGQPFTVENEEVLSVEITASPLSEDTPGHVNLAYMAFIKDTGIEEDALWQEQVSIHGNEKRTWRTPVPEGSERVDIWVFEQGDYGQVYHIFKMVNTEP